MLDSPPLAKARYALVNDTGHEVLHSALTRAVAATPQSRAPAGQWAGWLRGLKGIKQEELDWSGVIPWLEGHQGEVTKSDLLGYVTESEIQLGAITLNQELPLTTFTAALKALCRHLTQNESATQRGAKQYADAVCRGGLTESQMDAASPRTAELSRQLREAYASFEASRGAPAWNPRYRAHTLPGGSGYIEMLVTLPPAGDRSTKPYVSKHYPDFPNILGHVRLMDRQGAQEERVLFVEEIQSDWHQAGRRQGYRQSLRSLAEIDDAISHAGRERSALIDRAAGLPDSEMPAFRQIMDRVKLLADRMRDLSREWDAIRSSDDKVPDAPFKASWPLLVMKQVIRHAVDHGYDSIAWTTGLQQAERYDLRRKISRLQVGPADNGAENTDRLWVKGWQQGTDELVIDAMTFRSELPSIVGVAVSNRILADIGTERFSPRLYLGDDLEIGGDGMVAFYDQRLVTTLNRYVSRWGAKVTDQQVSLTEESAATVHGFPITPEMRAAALAGQPMFRLDTLAEPESEALVSTLLNRHAELGLSRNVTLRLVDQLRAVNHDGGTTASSGRYLRGVIDISMAAPDGFAVLNHEAIHALRDLGLFTSDEWGVLEAAAAANEPLMTVIKQRYRRQRLTEVELIEEAIAEMYADWASTQTARSGALGRLFERVRDFFAGLGRALRGAGFHTTTSVFRAIERGDVGRRPAPRGRPSNPQPPPTLPDSGSLDPLDARMSLRAKAPPSSPTESAAFSAWFGDSKVVDANGEPQVVYHGTTVRELKDGTRMGDIEAFDRMFTTRFRAPSMDTVGSWFSSTPGEGGAGMYAGSWDGSTVYPVYLSIKNPQVTTFHLLQRRARLLTNGKDDGRMLGPTEVEAYRSWLKEMGKDGVKIEAGGGNGDSTEFDRQVAWIALEPEQIKSALGNRGTFDPEDPRIAYRLTDQPEAPQVEQVARASHPVDLPSFKAWFGDSKVVDADGKPLVVYHGTNADFSEFNPDIAIHFERDKGKSFFYSAPKAASDYAEGLSDYKGGNANVMPVYLAMRRPRIIEVEGSSSEAWDMAGGRFEREAPPGTDGFIVNGTDYDGTPETMYVVTKPEQIKSAIGNRGTFDPEDPRIAYRLTDQPEAPMVEQVAGASHPVDLPSFKTWFGDSKVVDAEGRPLVVYHGTMADVSEFKRGDGGTYGAGLYFSKDPGEASFWAGDREGEGFDQEFGGNVVPAYVSIKSPADGDTASDYEARFGGRAWREMEKAGFDGVIAGDEIVAFRPEQIKSAIGNRGVFDPEDPRIDFRRCDAATARRAPWQPDAGHQTEGLPLLTWFGESKVVDAEGKPLVVYHGGANVQQFKPNTFFSESEAAAKEYRDVRGEGAVVTAAYLSIGKPAKHDDVVSAAAAVGVAAEDDAWVHVSNRYVDDRHLKVIAELKRRGFDGAFFDTDYGASGCLEINSWVAFDPDQIRFAHTDSSALDHARAEIDDRVSSAIGNRGTFDPASPDIRYALPKGEVGRTMTKAERDRVLSTLVDVYKAKGAPMVSKGVGRNGNERSGYAYSPDLFEKSDVTGAMVRYYVTLPDGRKAHPTELFPSYTQSDIEVEMARRARRAATIRDRIAGHIDPQHAMADKHALAKHWDDLSEASRVRNGGRHATIYGSLDREFLTDGQRYIMVPTDLCQHGEWIEAFADAGWRRSPPSADTALPGGVRPSMERRADSWAPQRIERSEIVAKLHQAAASASLTQVPHPDDRKSGALTMKIMTTVQKNTVIAALRYWQREGLLSSGCEHDIATDHGGAAMTATEIDEFVEAFNCGAFDDQVSQVAKDGAGAISALLHQVGQMRGMFKDEDGTIAEAVEAGEAARSRLSALASSSVVTDPAQPDEDEDQSLAMG